MKHEQGKPTPTSEEVEKTSVNVEVGFVNAVHSGKYTQEIVDSLAEGDAIAIEVVGLSQELREELTDAANAIIRLPKDAPERGELLEKFEVIEENSSTKPIFLKLFNTLSSSDKSISFIDISTEHEAFEDPAITFYLAGAQRVRIHTDNTEGAKETILEMMERGAKTNTAREDLVAEQLMNLVQELDEPDNDGNPKKLRVFVGQMHTAPMHVLRKAGVKTSREFVPALNDSELKQGRGKMLLPFYFEGTRQLRFSPESEISDELLGNTLLEFYLIEPLKNAGFEEHERTRASRIIIESLGQEGVQDTLRQLDLLREGGVEGFPEAHHTILKYMTKLVDDFLEHHKIGRKSTVRSGGLTGK